MGKVFVLVTIWEGVEESLIHKDGGNQGITILGRDTVLQSPNMFCALPMKVNFTGILQFVSPPK